MWSNIQTFIAENLQNCSTSSLHNTSLFFIYSRTCSGPIYCLYSGSLLPNM